MQGALAESAHLSWDTMLDALDVILGEELWQMGGQFHCFAEFAIGLQPAGLGVRSLRPLKLLRYALLANGSEGGTPTSSVGDAAMPALCCCTKTVWS